MNSEKPVTFIPTLKRDIPPTKLQGRFDDKDVYRWYITEDEYFRLSKLFGRDFQETGVGATFVVGLPSPCEGCGKYTEFIDWVWTAVQRRVHSAEFIFKSLQNGRQGDGLAHDVYCSECGLLTIVRTGNKYEGGEPDIFLAGRLDRSAYPIKPRQPTGEEKTEKNPEKAVVWGKWWIDDNGSTAEYRRSQALKESSTASRAPNP